MEPGTTGQEAERARRRAPIGGSGWTVAAAVIPGGRGGSDPGGVNAMEVPKLRVAAEAVGR